MSDQALLAVAMRPRKLDDFVGQDKNIGALRKQVAKSGIPHTIIIVGSPGNGKTTLMRILTASILFRDDPFGEPSPEHYHAVESGVMDYMELNAGEKGGVDEIRSVLDNMRRVPMMNNSSKIVGMDEAHRLTTAAKDAMLSMVEEPPDHAYWIFATSNASKLDAAFRRRAYIINMGAGLGREDQKRLLQKAIAFDGHFDPTSKGLDDFLDALDEVGVSSPGVILQAAERWMNGLDARSAVTFADETKIDVFAVAQQVAKGSWSGVSKLLVDDAGKLVATKEDAVTLRIVTTSYLRSMMLKGNKSVQCARAIGVLCGVTPYVDALELSATLGALCGACSLMAG